MSLYDSYQLANSTKIPTYQGSVVPELAKVSQQMQQRYDTAQQEQDYVGRFINSMQALPEDKAALQDLSNRYKSKLSSLSSRPDLENTLRDTAMLAHDVPSAYAPFARNLKDYTTYQDQLNEAVEKGDITAQTAQAKLAMSTAGYKGLQYDPQTGQYTGRFVGQNYVKDLNPDELVDKWMTSAAPDSLGYETQRVGDKWLVTNKYTGKEVSSDRIKQIIAQAASNNSDYQAWAQQQADIGTFGKDYSKLQLSPAEGDMVVGSIRNPQGKAEPLTLTQALQMYKAQGKDPGELLKQAHQELVKQQLLKGMQDYGVNKYAQHLQHSQTLGTNAYGVADYRQKLKDQVSSIAATILQPTAAGLIADPTEMTEQITSTGQSVEAAKKSYDTWVGLHPGMYALTKDGRKIPAADEGKVNVFDPGTRWFTADGHEMTGDGQKWIDLRKQAIEANNQLKSKREDAMNRANFHPTAAATHAAKEAYNNALKGRPVVSANGTVTYVKGGLTRVAQEAYDRVIHRFDPTGYARYKAILTQDAKGNSEPIGLQTFTSKELNKTVLKHFNDLQLNLGSGNGAMQAQGVQWAAGPNAGTPLDADDYKKMIGKASFIGVGIDTDGKYKMYFKVGTATTSKGKAVGEDNIVKMDAYSGVAKALVDEGLISPARQYLIQNMDQVSNTAGGSGTIQLGNLAGDGEDLQVHFRKVTPSEIEQGYVAPSTHYIISYPGSDGKTVEVPASSVDQAANNIIQTLQAHKSKK